MSRASEWMAGHKKSAVITLAVVLAVALGMTFLFRQAGTEEQGPKEEKIFTVRVLDAEATGNDVSVKYTGLVQPSEIIQCIPETISTIETLYVQEGDFVTKGQAIARLDAESAQKQASNLASIVTSAENALREAREAEARAQADYDKACEPADADLLSNARAERDSARSTRDAKQAELDHINILLAPYEEDVQEAKAEYEAAMAVTNAAREALGAAGAEVKKAEDAHHAAADTLAALKQQETEEGPSEELSQKIAEAEAAEQAAAAAKNDAVLKAGAAEDALGAAVVEEDAKAVKLAAAQQELSSQKLLLGHASVEAALAAAQVQTEAREAEVKALESKGADSQIAAVQKQRLEAAGAAVQQAQVMYDTAKMNHASAAETAADNILRAPAAGHVVKVVGSEGSLAAPIAPVVAIASPENTVQFGVSQSDAQGITEGMDATVTVDGQVYYGHVSGIALLPDETTRTYPVTVEVESSEELFLGSMATVELGLGQRTGVWLPLSVILNDGQDYVYIVQDGHALRKDVEITEISNDKVLVMGIDAGAQVIREGMKTVRSGSAVQIVGESGGEAE